MNRKETTYEIEIAGELARNPLVPPLYTLYTKQEDAVRNALSEAERAYDLSVDAKISVTRYSHTGTSKSPSGVKVVSKRVLLVSVHPDTPVTAKVARLEAQLAALQTKLTAIQGEPKKLELTAAA